MKSFCFFLIFFFCFVCSAQNNYTAYVNPFIGTGGHGHTYPGATLPFGMVQLSPDTRLEGWDACSGYHYSDSIIYGFSHTHLSGTGIADYCDILLMPTVGETQLENITDNNTLKGYASAFTHAKEKASPGFYSVFLEDDKIPVELTTTTRVGFHKYSFPKTDRANIVLDLNHRDELLEGSFIKIISNKKIEGCRRSSSWAADQWIYFAIEFSQPFLKYDNAEGMQFMTLEDSTIYITGKQLKLSFHFVTGGENPIYVKCALSPVRTTGAWSNMEAEIPHWDFEKIKTKADETWNTELSKIEVTSDDLEKKIIFYTALYHCMLAPNIYMNVDKKYRGRDKEIHVAENFNYYTVFSLWDTYRALHPLLTIIDQKRTSDFINTFIKQYEQGGRLPVWELSANETNTMIGYHGVSVIADATIKGISGFDKQLAYDAMKDAQMLPHGSMMAYRGKGFFESKDESESVSKTIEYSYDDWCIAQMGLALGADDFRNNLILAKNWTNLYDGKFIRPRFNGGWYTPFDPAEVNFNYTEANAWQYNFAPVHDLGTLFPPDKKAENEKRLDQLFTSPSEMSGRQQADITGLIGQYAHGNEPSHHVAYLYNYTDATHKTQFYVNKIRSDFYKNTPDGLIGNEDCGQMSAWYVFSAMGFYPVCPGSDTYACGTPLFDEVRIHLENGKTSIIRAHDRSGKNIYVFSVVINEETREYPVILHSDIMNGSVIEFYLSGDSAQTIKGEIPKSLPKSIPLSPIITGEHVFTDSMQITIHAFDPSETVLYNLEGKNPIIFPGRYTKPITIHKSTTLMAVAKSKTGSSGRVCTAIFKKIPDNFNVTYVTTYDNQYTGGGNYGLVDSIRGSKDFRTGSWQGWWGNDMEVIIDLGGLKQIDTVKAGFLQDIKSWIWMPVKMDVWVSSDGINYSYVDSASHTIPAESNELGIKDLVAGFSETSARYIKVKAYNVGTIPKWHPGAGEKAWIFCDEVIVR
ncbi:MAG: glycoside hydrolase family 92 protein [Chitinophagales bacterium]|nr:glycoside hydrolase family 92 protein [Chitinophagales bacterium]